MIVMQTKMVTKSNNVALRHILKLLDDTDLKTCYAVSVNELEKMYGKDSEEVTKMKTLERQYRSFSNDLVPKKTDPLIESKYRNELAIILNTLRLKEDGNVLRELRAAQEDLKTPDKELPALEKLQQYLYECEDGYYWLDMVLEIFKQVYGPSGGRTRFVRENLESLPISEEGMPDFRASQIAAFQKAEKVMDAILADAHAKINKTPMEPTSANVSAESKTRWRWFDFSKIPIGVWGLILVVIGAAFTLGKELGHNKFDAEKNVLYQEKLQLQDQVKQLEAKTIMIKDSMSAAASVKSK